MPKTIKEYISVVIPLMATLIGVAFGYGVLNTKVELNDKKYSDKCVQIEKESYDIKQDVKELVKMSNENSKALSRIEGILSK
jgi:hypothetical protein